MKSTLTIALTLLSLTASAQFALVSDKDGYVNVRAEPKTGDNIVDTLHNGHLISLLEVMDNGWCYIDCLTKKLGGLYIHRSRLKFIGDLKEIKSLQLTDSIAAFGSDSIKIVFHSVPFQVNQFSAQEKEKIIAGQFGMGTDGHLPAMQYAPAMLQMGSKHIQIPVDGLFEPNLSSTKVTIDPDTQTVYIQASNGDAAYSYAVLWIIDKNENMKRLATVQF